MKEGKALGALLTDLSHDRDWVGRFVRARFYH